MGKVRASTQRIFEIICKDEGATRTTGMTNPVKIEGATTIIYSLKKEQIYKCLIDTDCIGAISLNCTWVVNNSKLSTRPRVIAAGHGMLSRILVKAAKGYVIDHINGDTLDNRLLNLRAVTPGVNLLNKKRYSNSTITNIRKTEKGYILLIARVFESLEMAAQAKEDIINILNKHSLADAEKRSYSVDYERIKSRC